jgi:hypothetical protein
MIRFWRRGGPSEEAKAAKATAQRSKCLAEIDKRLARKAWMDSMPDLEEVRANYKAALDGAFSAGIFAEEK